MYGFKNKMEYYRASKLKGKLHNLRRCPTMFLESWDDFLSEPHSYPVEEIKNNPNVLMAITERGGHVCHLTHSKRKITGLPLIDFISWFLPSTGWYAEPVMDFIDTIERQHRASK